MNQPDPRMHNYGAYPPPQWMPPPPPAKKRRTWPWIVGGIVLFVVVMSALAGHSSKPTPQTSATPAWTAGASAQPAEQPTPAQTGPLTSFSDGTYEVGTDIQPGKYKTAGGDGCYWERQKNDDHNFGSIIANDYSKGPMTVTIAKTDKYFQTNGCTWTKVG